MGTQNPQIISENIVLIADSNTWIEGNAIQQLQTTARLPQMHHVAGMPDLHAGRGYPVGAAFFSLGRFYPALIGNDIGCGMALWQTNLPAHKAKPAKLAKQLGSIDAPLDESWQERINEILPQHPFQVALGTIGGGNHFAELQTVDTVYRPERLPENFDTDCLQLLVHSGSRGLGQQVLRRHVDAHGHQGLPENSPEAAAYLAEHNDALAFARANRLLIAERMFERWHAEGRRLLDAIGWAAILSQLLAALGTLFDKAGIGGTVSYIVAQIVPTHIGFAVAAAYCIGMAFFTVIMGNAFAAFAVMTTGIGIPLAMEMHHANPLIVAPIAMLAGYCGTLMTPMAANFNIVPAALLEMNNKYGVIKAQIPVALLLLASNIFLMYFLGF